MVQTVRVSQVVRSSPTIWETIPHLVKDFESVSLGRFRAEDMLELVRDGVFQFWTVWDDRPRITGALLTELVQYPRRKILAVPFVAGVGLDQWKDVAKMLEVFGRENGCDEIEGWGKKGWGRVLGWEVPYYGLRKVL